MEESPHFELTSYESIRKLSVVTTSRGRKLFLVWVILLMLTFIPWPWFYSPEPYLSGWLPFPLFYFWVVEFVYVAFVIYVGVTWAESKQDAKDEMRRANASERSVGGDT